RLLQLLVGGLRGDADAWRYIALLALATVPAVFVGLFLRDAVVRLFDLPAVTGVMLLLTGALLWSTRYVRADGPPRPPSWPIALLMGVAQAVAILPGISRSGASIAAGLWGGVDGERAAEFSFLMSIPAIA